MSLLLLIHSSWFPSCDSAFPTVFQCKEVYISVSTVLGTENIIFNDVFLEQRELSNLLNKRNHSRGQFPALRTKEKIGISVVNDDNLQ